jgi:hypothetical protein
MSRGELDQVTLEQIDSRLPHLATLGDRVFGLSPGFVPIAFPPESSVPLAAACLHDAFHVACEARYALHEAFAHLAWYREKRPTPDERAAVWFARFYTTAAASCLYASAEDLANAVIEMFELDRGKVNVGERSSLQSKVGAYLVKNMPTEAVTKAVCTLTQSDPWGKAMTWRNRWVHEQSLVEGLGIVYKRKKRWKGFVEADGTHGFELSFGGGDKPEHSVEDVLGFVSSAFEGFVRTFDEVVTCYLGILAKAGITHESGREE